MKKPRRSACLATCFVVYCLKISGTGGIDMNDAVSIRELHEYDTDKLTVLLRQTFDDLGVGRDFFAGRHVVIKPNLVSPRTPDKAATVHPSFLTALGRIVSAFEPASLILAESGGAPYTEATLKNLYRVCGIDTAAEDGGISLNLTTDCGILLHSEGKMCREFHVLQPILDADVVIDLCKLKAHSLTKMSCAAKNFFGTVPGIEKFAMHARFPEIADFQEMITDLASAVSNHADVLCVCDAVVCMEGNGPTNGTPRPLGAVLASRSPFTLDVAAEHLLGFDGTVPLCDVAASRGLTPRDYKALTVLGDNIEDLRLTDCKEPDAQSGFLLKKLPKLFGGRVAHYFSPRPEINRSVCVGCGKCRDSCPVHTIEIVEKDGRKTAKIHKDKCIHCFCCQELCPLNAVKIQKNILLRIVH